MDAECGCRAGRKAGRRWWKLVLRARSPAAAPGCEEELGRQEADAPPSYYPNYLPPPTTATAPASDSWSAIDSMRRETDARLME